MIVRQAPAEHYAWIAERAQLVIGDQFRALEALDGDRILGMVGYDAWTLNACNMHVALDSPIAVRGLLPQAFELPFKSIGVVTCNVVSTNERSLRLVRHLGFKELTRVRDGWAVGIDMLLFEMRREDCKWIGLQRKAA